MLTRRPESFSLDTRIADVPPGLSGWELAAAFAWGEAQYATNQSKLFHSLMLDLSEGFNPYHVNGEWDDWSISAEDLAISPITVDGGMTIAFVSAVH